MRPKPMKPMDLHDTGRIYDTDLEEILGFQKETATRLNDILTKLSALK